MAAAALAAGLLAVGPAAAAAQAIDQRWTPAGTLRWTVGATFGSWHERFGGAGEPGRVGLGDDLASGGTLGLFGGQTVLEQEVAALTGMEGYAPSLGTLDGRLQYDVTRIDLGAHLGITDWLEVGVSVPRVKTRSALDLVFQPDTIADDVGITPWISARSEVDAFLAALGVSRGAAAARAVQLCGAGDPGCASATALSERVARFDVGFAALYSGTPFFPLSGRDAASALVAAVQALDTDLVGAGLPEIGVAPVLADQPVTEADLATLPVLWDPLGYARPLQGRLDVWGWGDVEVSATVRALRLGGDPVDGGGGRMDLYAGVLVRLGTGLAPDPDAPLALGTGDGQTDVEGRVAMDGRYGSRWALRAGGRYGTQSARDLTVRTAVPGDGPIPSLASRTVARWEPAAYWSVEVEPGVRLGPPLTLAAHWRYAGQGDDRLSDAATGGERTRAWPGVGGAWNRQEAGVTLSYDTVDPSGFEGVLPLRVRVRVIRSLTGDGPYVPVETRVDVGAEILTSLGLWGS